MTSSTTIEISCDWPGCGGLTIVSRYAKDLTIAEVQSAHMTYGWVFTGDTARCPNHLEETKGDSPSPVTNDPSHQAQHGA